ncbi:MAG TPA: hypothetical protein VFF65_08190 [Phycisphaerales bacterium]|nr:hypothetical protein [Phycisphaerales bacterium]
MRTAACFLVFFLFSTGCAGLSFAQRHGVHAHTDVISQSQAEGVDYPALLQQAADGDPDSLVRVFSLQGLNAAGSQSHAFFLWTVVREVGDEAAAAAYRRCNTAARIRFTDHLAFELGISEETPDAAAARIALAADPDFRRDFPALAAAIGHQ